MRTSSVQGAFSSSVQILRQVDDILHHDMAIQGALKLILKVVAEGVGADSSSLLLLAPGRDELVVAAAVELQDGVASESRDQRHEKAAAARVLKTGGPLVFALPDSPGLEGESLAVPVRLGGESLGALCVTSRGSGESFSEEDSALLHRITSHIAVLVERLRLEEKLVKSLEGTRVLHEVSGKINSCGDLPALFGVLSWALPKLLAADCHAVLVLESPKPSQMLLCTSLKDEALKELEDIPERLAQHAARKRRLSYAFEADPAGAYARWAQKHHVTSGLAIPLLAKDSILGAIEIYTLVPYRFAPEEIWVLDNLAQLAAGAILNLSLHESLAQEQSRSVQQEKLATLGQLTAGIAHEINNPLSGIIGYLQLLRRGLKDSPEALADLEKIEKETHRLRRLADSMLSCVRPEKFQPASVHELIEMALSLLAHEVRRRGAAVEKEYRAIPPLLCDPAQLEQVFINMILNALQALEGRPERKLKISTSYDGEKQLLRVELKDTGCGIRPEDLPRIFEPHFTTKGSQGNGLGLALVRGSVERHGGTISVESSAGAGTSFRLAFPRR